MKFDLKERILDIAKENNLLPKDMTDMLDGVTQDANYGWSLIHEEPLLLVRNLLDDFPELKALMSNEEVLNNSEIDYHSIETAVFNYEIQLVLSLHEIVYNSISTQKEKMQLLLKAKYCFELQKVVPLPNDLFELVSRVVSLGLYGLLCDKNEDFNHYLDLLLPLIANIKGQLQTKLNQELESSSNNTSKAKSCCCETDFDSDDNSASCDNVKLNLSKELIILEFLPILPFIFKKDYQSLLTKFDEFKEYLSGFLKNLNDAISIKEKKDFTLYLITFSKVFDAIKVVAQHKADKNVDTKSDVALIEQHFNIAVESSKMLNMRYLEVTLRNLKHILILHIRPNTQFIMPNITDK